MTLSGRFYLSLCSSKYSKRNVLITS